MPVKRTKKSSAAEMVGNVVKVALALAPKNASEATKAAIAVEAVKADPVIVNEMNAEPVYQSRIAWGSAFALLSQVIPWVAPLVGVDADAAVEIVGQVGTVAGILYALYGRFWPRLKPLGRGGEPSDA